MIFREAHKGQHIRLCLVHVRGELRHFGTQLIGDLTPLFARGFGVVLDEGGANERRDHATALAAGMVALVAELPNPPLAFGANCGVGASDLLRTVLGFMAAEPSLPVIAKGNAGIPKFVEGRITYDGTPELMADYAVLARDCGARIIGGCCGTTPAHLRAMRAALESAPPGPVPDLATIQSRLGGFSSASDGLGDAPGGVVVAKHFWRSAPPERIGLLASERVRRFGETALTFYRRRPADEGRG